VKESGACGEKRHQSTDAACASLEQIDESGAYIQELLGQIYSMYTTVLDNQLAPSQCFAGQAPICK
jgi:hypothetical protein